MSPKPPAAVSAASLSGIVAGLDGAIEVAAGWGLPCGGFGGRTPPKSHMDVGFASPAWKAQVGFRQALPPYSLVTALEDEGDAAEKKNGVDAALKELLIQTLVGPFAEQD